MWERRGIARRVFSANLKSELENPVNSTLCRKRMIKVLDLFCGMGGLSLGFAEEGFSITGYDIHPRVPDIFRINRIGNAVVADLSTSDAIRPEDRDVHIVIGGPPCRPWSVLNIRRRKNAHPDYRLLEAFFNHVLTIEPVVFLMENVPIVDADVTYHELLRRKISRKYFTCRKIIRYADYGAATARRRLITIGFRKDIAKKEAPYMFFEKLRKYRREPIAVGSVIEPYLYLERGAFPDHEWGNFRTIEKYTDKYRSGKFGWYRLDANSPAPSFGNIMKTYILHPYAGNGRNIPLRVLSIREAMAIMGFPDNFRFPEGMGLTPRYQMVADAVSPVFSRVCARVLYEMLCDGQK